MSRAEPAATDAHRAERLVLVTAAAVTALVPLNSTMIAVALPDVVDDLEVGVGAGGWLITTYLVAMAVLQPIGGKLGDRVGRGRLVGVGLAGFGAASLGAGLAPVFPALLAFRVLQAVSGALMVPNASATVRAVLPAHRRASGFGVLGSAIGFAAASGPVVGAALMAAGGWRAVFLANVPVVGGAALAVLRSNRHVPQAAPLAAGDRRGRVLEAPGFRTAAIVVALSNLAMYSVLVAVPLLLDERGWSASSGALALAALTLAMTVMAPFGGRAADVAGRRFPAVAGMWVLGAAVVPLALSPSGLHGALVVAVLAIAGLGAGFTTAPVQTTALESVPADQAGSAAGLFSTLRYAGSFVGTAVLSLLLASGDRFGAVFAMSVVAAVLAALVAMRLPARPAPE